MSISDLPLLNASLNGLSTCFIVLGLVFIKRERKEAHTACMIAAVVTSTLFLTSYLTYHIARAGQVTHFTHPGWPKTLYFLILGTHTPLATIVSAARHCHRRPCASGPVRIPPSLGTMDRTHLALRFRHRCPCLSDALRLVSAGPRNRGLNTSTQRMSETSAGLSAPRRASLRPHFDESPRPPLLP